MKLTLALVISMISSVSFAKTYKITCDYEYETYTSYDELHDEFTVTGEVRGNQVIFNGHIKDIPSYFINRERYAAAIWHNDSALHFSAILNLKKKSLTYSFQYSNYVRSYDDFQTVFKQTRYLDMTEHFEEEELDFEYDDGKVVVEQINKEPWVNETHVSLDDCELTIF